MKTGSKVRILPNAELIGSDRVGDVVTVWQIWCDCPEIGGFDCINGHAYHWYEVEEVTPSRTYEEWENEQCISPNSLESHYAELAWNAALEMMKSKIESLIEKGE